MKKYINFQLKKKKSIFLKRYLMDADTSRGQYIVLYNIHMWAYKSKSERRQFFTRIGIHEKIMKNYDF